LAAAGDSRAVLVMQDGSVQALSFDHKPDRRDERQRINKEGGHIEYDHENDTYRVFTDEVGGLAVTRALGDVAFKPYVTSKPEIKSGKVSGDLAYVVMASDGLWDDVNNEEAGEVLTEMRERAREAGEIETHVQEAVKELVFIAYSRGSEDNITVMAIDLQKHKEAHIEAVKARTRKAKSKTTPKSKRSSVEDKKKRSVKRTIPGLDEYGVLSELLLWHHPLRSFLWLSVGSLVFFLTHVAGYSVVTLGSYLLMMQILIMTFVVQTTPILRRLHLVRQEFDSTVFVLQGSLLSDEVVQRAAQVAEKTAATVFTRWNTIVKEGSATNILMSLRFVSYFFTPFPLDVVLFIMYVAMFSLPATYNANKPFLDRQYAAMLAGYKRLVRQVTGTRSSSRDLVDEVDFDDDQ